MLTFVYSTFESTAAKGDLIKYVKQNKPFAPSVLKHIHKQYKAPILQSRTNLRMCKRSHSSVIWPNLSIVTYCLHYPLQSEQKCSIICCITSSHRLPFVWLTLYETDVPCLSRMCDRTTATTTCSWRNPLLKVSLATEQMSVMPCSFRFGTGIMS